ncbi:hypothetical protein [Ancylobacter oerskovii]|uniref:Uncharacterized protein n=1 Tax=Ancylobacter oerskovii TaxID=459519 RepID=A0ABW4YYH1_9HYPH|nr:hypothetical protein [Ancylobacter oerskovii]MBS7541630.1 hypothetical protein [Ancylobacter oerskovii]
MTLQLDQARNIPADAPQLWPRKIPPLGAIGADDDQHVELYGEAAQRCGVCRKELSIKRSSSAYAPASSSEWRAASDQKKNYVFAIAL